MRVLVFDTETSGLPKHHFAALNTQPHVLEFAGIVIDNKEGEFEEVQRFTFYANPGIRIDDEITKINGISEKTLKGEKPFSYNEPVLSEMLRTVDAVAAHNLPFDMKMINFEYTRLGMDAPWPPKRICTIEATMHLAGYRLKLQALHELLLGVGFEGAHRAMNDTEALVRCFKEMAKRGMV